MMSLSVSRKSIFVAALLCFLPWLFGQISGDTVGPITSALRARDFDKALQLLQPALQQISEERTIVDLAGDRVFGQQTSEKEALASFRNALKISPDYLPALEGAAQLEYKAGSDAAIPLLQHVLKLRPGDPTSHAMLAVLFAKRRRLRFSGPTFRAERFAAGFSTRRAAAVRRLPGETEAVGESNICFQPSAGRWTPASP